MFNQKSARLLAGAAVLSLFAVGCVEEQPSGPDPVVREGTYEANVRVDFPEMTEDDDETPDIDESVPVLDEDGNIVVAGSVNIPFGSTATVTETGSKLSVALEGTDPLTTSVEFDGAVLELTYQVVEQAPLKGSLSNGVSGSIVIDVTNVDLYAGGELALNIPLEYCPMTVGLTADIAATETGYAINQKSFDASVTQNPDHCASQGELIAQVLASPYNEIDIDIEL